MDLKLISQAYENLAEDHKKIIYQKQSYQVLAHSEQIPNGWKKSSAAQILHSILKQSKSLSCEDLVKYAGIAQVIANNKNHKIGKRFSFVRHFFSHFQNFSNGLGFQTSIEMNRKIQKNLLDQTRKIQSKEKTYAAYKTKRLAPAKPVESYSLSAKIKAHESQLAEIFQNINNGCIHEAEKRRNFKQISSGNLYVVFELTDIPGVVFKAPHKDVNVAKRFENTNRCRQIIIDNHFDRLYIPFQEHLTLLNGQKVDLLIEEKVNIGNFNQSRDFYAFCCTDPELKEDFKIEIEQLIAFILLADLSDAKADNIAPWFEGKAITLVDLEAHSNSGLTGVITLLSPYLGLVDYLTPEFISIIENTAKKYLNPECFAQLDFKTAYERSKKAVKMKDDVQIFYQKNHIVDGSPLKVRISRLGLSLKRRKLAKTLLAHFNESFKENASLTLMEQRKCCFTKIEIQNSQKSGTRYEDEDYKEVLSAFKKAGILFDFEQNRRYITAQF